VDIRAGERVGLVGRSGSGKTTFVKLVQRLYDVSGGRILIDGQDIAKAIPRERGRVGKDRGREHRLVSIPVPSNDPGTAGGTETRRH
jgi:ABC-type oligopeptide transport system ATPase subunit